MSRGGPDAAAPWPASTSTASIRPQPEDLEPRSAASIGTRHLGRRRRRRGKQGSSSQHLGRRRLDSSPVSPRPPPLLPASSAPPSSSLLRPHSRPSPSLGPHGNDRVFRSGFRRGKGEIERLDGAMTDTRRRLASMSATHGAAGSAGSGRGRLGRQRARRSRPGARIGGDAHTRSDGDRFCCQHRRPFCLHSRAFWQGENYHLEGKRQMKTCKIVYAIDIPFSS
uniref:Uncharacterized protein n=1 Tax=Triticum urartu TaxID=4572 RepID=A0A8R7UEC9_TRIUA